MGGASAGEDALSPELYPDIVKSTPFLLELFDVKVKDQKGKVDTTLYAYLDKYQRSSWMGAVVSAPFKALGWTLSLFKDKPEKREGKIDPFHLTVDETRVAEALSKRILVTIDKKQALPLRGNYARPFDFSFVDRYGHALFAELYHRLSYQ